MRVLAVTLCHESPRGVIISANSCSVITWMVIDVVRIELLRFAFLLCTVL